MRKLRLLAVAGLLFVSVSASGVMLTVNLPVPPGLPGVAAGRLWGVAHEHEAVEGLCWGEGAETELVVSRWKKKARENVVPNLPQASRSVV
jgi:hypothetical protein